VSRDSVHEERLLPITKGSMIVVGTSAGGVEAAVRLCYQREGRPQTPAREIFGSNLDFLWRVRGGSRSSPASKNSMEKYAATVRRKRKYNGSD
jgi:hypothetical protein